MCVATAHDPCARTRGGTGGHGGPRWPTVAQRPRLRNHPNFDRVPWQRLWTDDLVRPRLACNARPLAIFPGAGWRLLACSVWTVSSDRGAWGWLAGAPSSAPAHQVPTSCEGFRHCFLHTRRLLLTVTSEIDACVYHLGLALPVGPGRPGPHRRLHLSFVFPLWVYRYAPTRRPGIGSISTSMRPVPTPLHALLSLIAITHRRWDGGPESGEGLLTPSVKTNWARTLWRAMVALSRWSRHHIAVGQQC